MKLIYLLSIYTLLFQVINAQNYIISEIPANIKSDNKVVVRDNQTIVNISSIDKIRIKQLNAYSIFDASGSDFYNFDEYYSNGDKVIECKINVYDKNGNLTETIKKKDFIDQKLISDANITDNHVLFYKYTPTALPITLEFIYEYESHNTAFIPSYVPINMYNVGIVKSSYQLINSSGIDCRYKIYHNDSQLLKDDITSTEYYFGIENFEGINYEPYSPSIKSIYPYVAFSLDEFNLEGKKGNLSSWQVFGKWYYDELIDSQTHLNEEFRQKLSQVTAPAKSQREKVQLIYEYLQKNMRYVSVQLGIGGWKPMDAQQVEDLKYGDCKALSNFMMASLNSVGIKSNLAILKSSSYYFESFDPDFPRMQGNHVILSVPMEKDTIWLECTSNDTAFNYITSHNDNRLVLAVNEKGGKIIKTPKLEDVSNKMEDKSIFRLDEKGNVLFSSEMIFTGSQYSFWLGLKYKDDNQIKKELREVLDHLAGIEFNTINYHNNKTNAEFKLEIDAKVPNYAKKVGKNLLFNVVPFNRKEMTLEIIEDRKTDLVIPRGFSDLDSFTYIMPPNSNIPSMPKNIYINDDKFGTYSLELSEGNNNSIVVKREFLKKSGTFPPSAYNDYVKFNNKIYDADQTKIIIELQLLNN